MGKGVVVLSEGLFRDESELGPSFVRRSIDKLGNVIRVLRTGVTDQVNDVVLAGLSNQYPKPDRFDVFDPANIGGSYIERPESGILQFVPKDWGMPEGELVDISDVHPVTVIRRMHAGQDDCNIVFITKSLDDIEGAKDAQVPIIFSILQFDGDGVDRVLEVLFDGNSSHAAFDANFHEALTTSRHGKLGKFWPRLSCVGADLSAWVLPNGVQIITEQGRAELRLSSYLMSRSR